MESQESGAKTQERSENEFIKEFNYLSREDLQAYEQKHRQRILEAPFVVVLKFNDKWSKLFQRPYFQPINQPQQPDVKQGRTDPRSKKYKGFWEVIFSPKSSPNDPEDVTLSLNGNCLQIKRDVPVVLPGPFLEVADHGVYPTFVQLPNQPRKVTGYVKFFPYTVLREASKEEFLRMKREGDKVTREARAREEAMMP